MLEIDILRNSSQISLGVLRVGFKGFGCPKRHVCDHLYRMMKERGVEGVHMEKIGI